MYVDKLFRYLVFILVSILIIGCKNGDNDLLALDSMDEDIYPVTLKIFTENNEVPMGFDIEVSAFAKFSDNSTVDVTQSVYWSVSDSNVAQITNTKDERGIASGLASGDVVINAEYNYKGVAITDSANFIVTPAYVTSLDITPNTISVIKGSQAYYVAKATFSDDTTLDVTKNSNLTWSIDNTNVVITTLTPGIMDAVGEGIAEITATLTHDSNSISSHAEINSIEYPSYYYIRQTSIELTSLPTGDFFDINYYNDICALSELVMLYEGIISIQTNSSCKVIDDGNAIGKKVGVFQFTVQYTLSDKSTLTESYPVEIGSPNT